MRIIVSFSGGKDSQACLIKACQDFGAANVTAVFCDTGWEHDLTYIHVHEVTDNLGCKLEIIRNEHFGREAFANLCRQMKWFPDTQHRMCTVQLKIMPMIDWILQQRENLLIIQGIRAAESKQRSMMTCSGDYFAEYEREKKLYRKTDVLCWKNSFSCVVERPMFGYSAQDIIDFILDAGQKPNPLYSMGYSRVGCFPCIYARLSELKLMRKERAYIERLSNLEDEVTDIRRKEAVDNFRPATFFAKNKIPERFCTKYRDLGIPTAEDVFAYVSRDDAQLDMFDDEGQTSCMSIYHGLCE